MFGNGNARTHCTPIAQPLPLRWQLSCIVHCHCCLISCCLWPFLPLEKPHMHVMNVQMIRYVMLSPLSSSSNWMLIAVLSVKLDSDSSALQHICHLAAGANEYDIVP
jgi:hypothetical protein